MDELYMENLEEFVNDEAKLVINVISKIVGLTCSSKSMQLPQSLYHYSKSN